VIVSASRGQYLKPGSFEPGFFSLIVVTSLSRCAPLTGLAAARIIRT
jgi:hypothetical protein